MRRILLFVVSVACATVVAFGQSEITRKRVAVLDPDIMMGDVSERERMFIRGYLETAFSQMRDAGYTAVARQGLDKAIKEQRFSHSDLSDDAKRMGIFKGADLICITNVGKERQALFLDASLMDVQTGDVLARILPRDLAPNELANGCQQAAQDLVAEMGGSAAPQRTGSSRSSSTLQNGFTVDAASIGKPSADGISGIITGTGGTSYKVRSIGGAWWMIQNANKPLSSSGCTHRSIDRGPYGQLYSWDCASQACPPGWSLPTDDEFSALSIWLTDGNLWREWNSGHSLAGRGNDGRYNGYQGSVGYWWSSSSSVRHWYVHSGNTSGNLYTDSSSYSFSVRCRKSQ
jgi:uncharacterized protein (TIGR02145 family)